LGWGSLILISSAIIASLINARFMGILNLHSGDTSLVQAIVDIFVNVTFMVLPLWFCGKLLSKTNFRMLDLLGTQMLARWPLQMSGLAIGSLPIMQELSSRFINMEPREVLDTLSAVEITTLIVVGFLVLAINVWTITLMFNSYRISCNLVGMRAGISFGSVLIIAGPLSTLCLYSLPPF